MLTNESKRDDVFTFNPIFGNKNWGHRPKFKMSLRPGEDKLMKKPDKKPPFSKFYEFKDEFIFPIKIFLNSNHTDDTKITKNIRFKIMIIYNKTFPYTDQSN
jgi:hypothetical protein